MNQIGNDLLFPSNGSDFSASVQLTPPWSMWDGKDYRYAQVKDMPVAYQFYPGDTIVTSHEGDFPEGIPVGYIEEAEPEQGTGFYKVKILLATNFNKLDHVYIIKNRFREEQDKLMEETLSKYE